MRTGAGLAKCGMAILPMTLHEQDARVRSLYISNRPPPDQTLKDYSADPIYWFATCVQVTKAILNLSTFIEGRFRPNPWK